MSQQDIITQVTPDSYGTIPQVSYDDNEDIDIDYNSKIHLNIRGKEFIITRDELMSLPESILLCLFPNGVFLDVNGQIITNLTEDDIVYVNFDPVCFQYIIEVFQEAAKDLEEMEQHHQQQQQSSQASPTNSFLNIHKTNHSANQQENVLQSKPAIIVLREDLDFYVIPPFSGINSEQMKQLKLGVSIELLKNKLIFSGLGYKFDQNQSPHQQQHPTSSGLGPAEQHLFDMLCSSGFDPTEKWGSRSLEPNKCVISSLSLIRLKSPQPPSEPDSPSLTPTNSNTGTAGGSPNAKRSRSRIAQLATSASRAASRSLSSTPTLRAKHRHVDTSNQTKLLLFWRKPARKCWWSDSEVEIELDAPGLFNGNEEVQNGGNKRIAVKVHIRRVWTLELSVIGVS
ncbi:uncharacterized protein J8A68_003141 [[Candida] subhashii]|uniref:Growth regulation protein n=1 Tax=[Candida] subhashii TaxID=561895 RepID=A0A8J5QJT6_9ASCO|nr:uncharacterized protein J8A68_003141 [[Candida] subhashii]KAG7663309.1 hypothetical protein J8A68_003141 [[Candida] subhashii]